MKDWSPLKCLGISSIYKIVIIVNLTLFLHYFGKSYPTTGKHIVEFIIQFHRDDNKSNSSVIIHIILTAHLLTAKYTFYSHIKEVFHLEALHMRSCNKYLL